MACSGTALLFSLLFTQEMAWKLRICKLEVAHVPFTSDLEILVTVGHKTFITFLRYYLGNMKKKHYSYLVNYFDVVTGES
jgi:hypothetical protein